MNGSGFSETPNNVHREQPFGGLKKDVSSQEYARSLARLKEFLDVDVDGIQNIKDLSSKTAMVGHDLRIVILAKGKIQETEFEYTKPGKKQPTKAIDITRVIREPVGNHNIFATSVEDIVAIDAYRTVNNRQLSIFTVHLPAFKDIAVSKNPMDNALIASAVDFRRTTIYYPAKESNNPAIQQGFARVLKDGIRDILSVLPSPSKIPDVFDK